jgi:hypothetical protein
MPERSRLYGSGYSNPRIDVRYSQLGGVCAQYEGSEYTISDSEILDLVDIDALYTSGGQLQISGLSPGFVEHWDSSTDLVSSGFWYGHLVIDRTYVDSWSVRLGGGTTTVEIDSSEIGWLRANWSTGPAVVRDSEVEILDCYGASESVLFDNSVVQRLSVKHSHMRLGGSVSFEDEATPWVDSTLIREFPIAVTDGTGASLGGVAVQLRSSNGELVWSGVTDADGQARFEVTFDDTNHDDTWVLLLPDVGESLGVRLLTETPIRLTVGSATEEELLEEVLSARFGVSVDLVASLIGEFGLAHVRIAGERTDSYERFILLLHGCNVVGDGPLGQPVWLETSAIVARFVLLDPDGHAVTDSGSTLSLVRANEDGSAEIIDVQAIPVNPGSGVYFLSYPTEVLGPGHYTCYLGTWIDGRSYAFAVDL